MPLRAVPNRVMNPSGLPRDFKLDTGLKLHPDAGRWSEVDAVEISARQTPVTWDHITPPYRAIVDHGGHRVLGAAATRCRQPPSVHVLI
jgi:hypothetical protein